MQPSVCEACKFLNSLNVSKTPILPKGVTVQTPFDMAETIIQTTPNLAHLRNDFVLDSFCPEGFIGIGVSMATDSFVQSFVAKKCRDIIDDVEKLDSIQDGLLALYTSNLFDFPNPPDFNILIRILC